MNSRLTQVDILRAIAITAVIIIHSISANILPFLAFKPQLYLLISFDQLLRFCVPFFFAISGYLLAGRYLHEAITYSSFLKKRALRLLPPYLLWSGIIYFYLTQIAHEAYPEKYNIFQIIFFGRADYDLYFIPALFYLYLLFPLLMFFYKKWPQLTLSCSLLLTASVIIFTNLVQNGLLIAPFKWSDQQQYVFPLTWIFYFVLGIYLKDQQEKKVQFLKTIVPIVLLTSIPLLIYSSIKNFATTGNLINATSFTQFPVLFYATGYIATTILWQEKFLLLPKIITGISAKIGQKSFSIYLFHTIVIRIVYDFYPATNLPALFIFIITTLFITFLTSAILGKLHTLLKLLLPPLKTVLP